MNVGNYVILTNGRVKFIIGDKKNVYLVRNGAQEFHQTHDTGGTMMKMKRFLAIAMAGVMTLGLAACGSSSSSSSSSASSSSADTTAATEAAAETEENAGGHLFGYTCMDLTNPFHIAMRDAIKEAVEANGDELIDIDGKSDQTNQNNAIEDMITQGIEVLFLNPVDSASVKPALEQCAEAGVLVVNVDSGVDDKDLIATYLSSNNFVAGQQCGEEIVSLYPDGANILVIENPLADSVVQRVAGLEAAIEGTNCTIVDRKSISTADAVLQNAEDLLTANDDVQVFWGLNDDVSLIIQGVVESAGRADDIKVFSVDGSPSGKTSVANGGLYATAAQSPVTIGEQAVECAYTLLDGGTVDAEYSIETTLITPDNVGDYSTDSWN